MTLSTYRIIEYHNDLSRVEVFLQTGKTHQIRVHMAHLGAPIVGDVRYGDPISDGRILKSASRRLFLHALRISFPHPTKGKRISISAPEPKEFGELMKMHDSADSSHSV